MAYNFKLFKVLLDKFALQLQKTKLFTNIFRSEEDMVSEEAMLPVEENKRFKVSCLLKCSLPLFLAPIHFRADRLT